MKKYLLVGLVLLSNHVFALFEDEEARKKINAMQDQLNNIEKSLEFKINQKFSKNLSKYNSELNELHDSISRLIGDIEVLQFEFKNSDMDFFPSTIKKRFKSLNFFCFKLFINFISFLLTIFKDVFLMIILFCET